MVSSLVLLVGLWKFSGIVRGIIADEISSVNFLYDRNLTSSRKVFPLAKKISFVIRENS